MFFLTRLVVEFLSPFNISFLLLLISLILLCLRKSRIAVGFCLGMAISLQIFCGYGLWVTKAIGAREAQFPALTSERLASLDRSKFRYIVVLGSAHVSDPTLPGTSQLGVSSLYRLAEGMRLFKILPGSTLVVTGGVGYDPVPNAQVVGQVAESLGIPGERIIREDRPRDTVQEAACLQPLLGQEPFILVTSALHMPRAMEIFNNLGMQPIAAPTDYIVKHHAAEPPASLFPSPANLDLSRRILYESIGAVWSRIKLFFTSSQ